MQQRAQTRPRKPRQPAAPRIWLAASAWAAGHAGAARAQDVSADPPTEQVCDISPYQLHIQTVLNQDEANAMATQTALFTRLEQTGIGLYQGVVAFDVTPAGRTTNVSISQTTGAPALDALILGIAQAATFGPFLPCMTKQALPMFVPFQVEP